MNRTTANFHILRRGSYPGRLIAVYDEASPALAQPELLSRLKLANPDRTVTVPAATPMQTIEQELSKAV